MTTNEPAASLGELPLADEDHPSGAVFWFKEPPDFTVTINVDTVAQVRWQSELPHVVVRMTRAAGSYAEAKSQSLSTAQRTLDLVSVHAGRNLSLQSTWGIQEHFVWWTTSSGLVLRKTSVAALPTDWMQAFHERIRRSIVGSLPPNIRIADPPVWPNWHPSFRYFRLSQLTTDGTDAFRNMYLAIESLLDGVVKNTGVDEPKWLRVALDAALDGQDLEHGDVLPLGPSESVTDYFLRTVYRQARLRIFHSKPSERPQLPHAESDEDHDALSEALRTTGYLYEKLARKHLGLDRRLGMTLAQGGFKVITDPLISRMTMYLTDDTASIDERKDDTSLNPRGASMIELRTRNAKQMERPFMRVFEGRCFPQASRLPGRHHGLVAALDDQPYFFEEFEAPLEMPHVDRFEAVLGLVLRNPGDLRQDYQT